MARRYDSRTTIFSPEGRLYQVEYAMEAISHAGTCLGVLASNGVVLAAEKKIASKLLEHTRSSEKIFVLNEHIAASVAGITSDANTLINYARLSAQRHTFSYQEPIPVEQLVQKICDLKQGYTQYGGLRPFGVSFIFGGWDREYGFQLYQSDPSGNYGAWKATCIGANNQGAQSILKQSLEKENEEITLDKALKLAVRVLSKTMDSTNLTPEKLEIGVLSRKNGETYFTQLGASETEVLLKEIEAEKKDKEDS